MCILCMSTTSSTEDVLNEVKQRLSRIDIDAVIGAGHDRTANRRRHHFALFPTIQHTERVDTAVAALYEGRSRNSLTDNTNYST